MTAQPSNREPDLVPLTAVRAGCWATVHHQRDRCPECELLCAMGLTDQCSLRVCRAGKTCIVQAGGTRLGLTSAVASRVYVRIHGEAEPGV